MTDEETRKRILKELELIYRALRHMGERHESELETLNKEIIKLFQEISRSLPIEARDATLDSDAVKVLRKIEAQLKPKKKKSV